MANKAQCNNCKDIIESTTVHDWQCCSCYRLWSNKLDTLVKDLHQEGYDAEDIWSHLQYLELSDHAHGIYIDGGTNYRRCGFFKKEDFIDLSETE